MIKLSNVYLEIQRILRLALFLGRLKGAYSERIQNFWIMLQITKSLIYRLTDILTKFLRCRCLLLLGFYVQSIAKMHLARFFTKRLEQKAKSTFGPFHPGSVMSSLSRKCSPPPLRHLTIKIESNFQGSSAQNNQKHKLIALILPPISRREKTQESLFSLNRSLFYTGRVINSRVFGI